MNRMLLVLSIFTLVATGGCTTQSVGGTQQINAEGNPTETCTGLGCVTRSVDIYNKEYIVDPALYIEGKKNGQTIAENIIRRMKKGDVYRVKNGGDTNVSRLVCVGDLEITHTEDRDTVGCK